VNFDYNFIRYEFQRLGYEFKRKTLCTVKLSRKLIPGHKSYSLGKICKELNIENESRHRAAGDAYATLKLFKILQSVESNLADISLKGLNSNLSKSIIDDLPERTGVYYFYNLNKEIIYIGKSKSIRSRILSHLNNNMTKKAVKLKNDLADISFEITGSELLALLLESNEIKVHKPVYNSAQRRSIFQFGLFKFTDENGYFNLQIKKNDIVESAVTSFSSLKEVKEFLFRLVEEYQLCQKLCGLYKTNGACFHYQIKQCFGACIGKETPDDYNLRVNEALEKYHFKYNSFFIIDKGRLENERSIVKIENGKYCGFGYLHHDECINEFYRLNDSIKLFSDNRDVQQIIKNYLRKNKVEQIIEFDGDF
jgi:DNA polymerase-3 subunit epsilon